MYKIKSLLITTIVVLSIGSVIIPLDPQGPETDPSETTETTETPDPTGVSLFGADPLEP
ncbi:hypothetical protein NDGK_00790 [Clostridiales bacterium CHKCI001]|nr:hypothetical protein NDGK_00790 [Clostridiales bacterium CHKCI001]